MSTQNGAQVAFECLKIVLKMQNFAGLRHHLGGLAVPPKPPAAINSLPALAPPHPQLLLTEHVHKYEAVFGSFVNIGIVVIFLSFA